MIAFLAEQAAGSEMFFPSSDSPCNSGNLTPSFGDIERKQNAAAVSKEFHITED
jgi:hypothetical protein